MSLLFNHHNDDNNINTTTTITTTKTTTKPHNKYSKWSEKYTQIKHQRIQEQNEARKIMEEERRLYRPKFVERPKEEEYCHNAHEFVPYRYSWGARNETCMICDRFMHDNTVNTDDNGDMSMKSNIEEQKEEEYGIQSCELCPAVAHNSCIMNYERKNANDKTFSPPGNQKISSSSPSLHSKHHHWWCPDCSYEVSSYLQFQTSRHKMHQRKKLEFDSSLKLQASLMKLQEQNRYQKIRKGFLRLQAYARGVADRQGFMKDVATTHRVFRIKMGEFCDLWNAGSEGSRTNVSCISCVLNNNDSNEEEDYYDGDDDNQDDVENQLYRFETQVNKTKETKNSLFIYLITLISFFLILNTFARRFNMEQVEDGTIHSWFIIAIVWSILHSQYTKEMSLYLSPYFWDKPYWMPAIIFK